MSSCGDTAPNSWQNQLQVAAYGERTDSTEIRDPTTISTTIAKQHNVKEHGDQAGDPGPGVGNASEEKGITTTPKKMLKVRPDGKLISPKSRDIIGKPVRGSRKRSAKSETNKKQMIVILKYGKDEDSRKTTAQKIEEICSPADSNESNKLGTAKPSTATLGPRKPTHPFFLGQLARNPDQRTAATETQESDLKGAGSGQGQQNAKHSPKKINAMNRAVKGASAWASISGFSTQPIGSESSRALRFPEATPPVLPPQGMVHVGREIQPDSHITNILQTSKFLRMPLKMKDAAVHISEREELLRPYADLVKSCREEKNGATIRHGKRGIRYPARRIMTGPELQLTVRQNISCTLPTSEKLRNLGCKDNPNLNSFKSGQVQAHTAVLQAYESIDGSLTAFDKFECETQDWMHKYAPRSAEQVLQQGPEAMLLRDWLKRLTVTSVEGRSADASTSTIPLRKIGLNSRRKRQKKSGDLEGFVISSEEEMDHMDELADPRLDDPNLHASTVMKRSVLRSGDMLGPRDQTGSRGRATNAVVISGPHGCGKTAAVYAVAKELNFEVFEITAGSRRSGKDLLDKVGDMTRNHLVTRSHELNDSNGDEGDKLLEDVSLISDALKEDLESGRQGTMHSFFRPKLESEKKPKREAHKKSVSQQSKGKPKKSSSQKQSVILLEEVDVLFEEDKQFWATTLELILQSKRPIIMTCTDESLLPLDDLPLHAILRFTPSPEPLVTDYLLLIACNEGHLVSRQAVSALYRCKGYDLRASITELNFFCQMALGDTKAGLGWMLTRSSPQECQNEKGEALRVVSDGTYLEGMGWLTGEYRELGSKNWIDAQSYVLGDVINGWGMDTVDCEELVPRRLLVSQGQEKREETLKALEDLDHASDALSVADTYSCYDGRHNNSVCTLLAPVSLHADDCRLYSTLPNLNSLRSQESIMLKAQSFFKLILSSNLLDWRSPSL